MKLFDFGAFVVIAFMGIWAISALQEAADEQTLLEQLTQQEESK